MNQQLKTSSKMKKMISRLRIPGLLMLLATLLIVQFALAQQPQPAAPATPALPDTSKMSYNQISQQAKLYVYPAKGQNKQQQKSDEFECYKWAVEQSGIDPLNLPKVEAPPPQSGPTGSAVVGAAKGAAAGAAIGSISGDMGKGAAYGAMAGAIVGRRQGKQAQAQANQQSQQQASAKQKEMEDSFKKAFSVCLESKGYSIK
jgi:hypothetical protein